MTKPKAAVLFAGLLSCFPLARGVTQGGPVVVEGARVRVSLKSSGHAHYAGIIVALRLDTIVLAPEGRADSVLVPVSTIRRVAVSAGRESPWRGALKGGRIGMGVGGLVGLLMLFTNDCADFSFDWSRPSSGECTHGEEATMTAVLIGVPVAGAIIGALRPGEHWVQVPVKWLRAMIDARGVGLSFSF